MGEITRRRLSRIGGAIGIIGLTAMAGIGSNDEATDTQSPATNSDTIQNSPSQPLDGWVQIKFSGAEPVGP